MSPLKRPLRIASVALGLAFTAATSTVFAQANSRPSESPRREAAPRRVVRNELRPTTSSEVSRADYRPTVSESRSVRQTSYGFGPTTRVMNSSSMRPTRASRTMFQEEVIAEESVYDDVSSHAGVHFDGGCESCGHGDHSGGCDDCDSCGIEDCDSCGHGCLIPCPQVTFRNAEFFVGVQGFKGPANRGLDGSFGFNEGVNLGFRLPCMPHEWLSGQIGVNAVQSNFSGSGFGDENREQVFVTGGLFRRVDYGLQGGVVVDYRNEVWYTERNNAQLRGLLSWQYEGGGELGFQFTSSIQDDFGTSLVNGVNVTETWTPTNTNVFFYRHTFDQCSGANGRILAGFSGESDAYVGADWWMPLSERWALNGNFAYLIPEDGLNPAGSINESWNVGMNLVWIPAGLGRYRARYHRPMFNVADNGSFFTTIE